MSAEPFTLCENCRNYKFYNCACWRCKYCQSFLADDDSYKYCTKDACECPKEIHLSAKEYRKQKKRKSFKCKTCKRKTKAIQNKDTTHTFNEGQIDAWLKSETPKSLTVEEEDERCPGCNYWDFNCHCGAGYGKYF